MHRVKGLEFDHMLLASVNDGLVPLRLSAEAADATAKEEAETQERALLMSRHPRPQELARVELRNAEPVRPVVGA